MSIRSCQPATPTWQEGPRGLFFLCFSGSEVRPWPRVSHALRPKSDRLEAKQLRICLLSKRVAILRQKSKSRASPLSTARRRVRGGLRNRPLPGRGKPCYFRLLCLNRCLGAFVFVAQPAGYIGHCRHSTAGVTEMFTLATRNFPETSRSFVSSLSHSFCTLALGTRLVSFPLCTLLLLACHHFFNVHSSSPRYL